MSFWENMHVMMGEYARHHGRLCTSSCIVMHVHARAQPRRQCCSLLTNHDDREKVPTPNLSDQFRPFITHRDDAGAKSERGDIEASRSVGGHVGCVNRIRPPAPALGGGGVGRGGCAYAKPLTITSRIRIRVIGTGDGSCWGKGGKGEGEGEGWG